MGYITRADAVFYITQTIYQLYDKAYNSAEKQYWTQNAQTLDDFNSKLQELYKLSEDKNYLKEIRCISIEKLENCFNKVKELSKTYDLPGYAELKSASFSIKEDIQVRYEQDLEKIDKENVIEYFKAIMKVYAFEFLEENCKETERLKMSYLGSDTGRNHKNLDCLTEIYKVYDLNKKQISELTNRVLMLNQSLSHAGSVPDPTGTFIKNCQNQIASCKYQISILQEANNQLVKKYPAVQFIGKGKSKTEEIRKGFEKVENAQDNLFKDIMEDKVPLHQIDIIRDKALERIESEYKDDKEKIEQVKKYIEKAEKVDFYLNIGKTVLSLALVAACFFAPAGSALAIGIATGSATVDLALAVDDLNHAAMANELAYASAIGNQFTSTTMASADFYYGMALFNVVLSAISMGEITKSVNQYKKFNSLSEEGKKVLTNSKVLERSRLLEGLSEADLNKLGKLTENQVEKISKLSNEQIVKILNSPQREDILKAIDDIPVEKFDDIELKLGNEISQNLDEIVQKSGSKGNWNKVLNNELEPNKVYKVDTYNYHTDSIGRVDNVSGNLRFEPKGRNLYQQGKAVELKNGLKGEDEGGHIIAQIFNGPGEQINYVPQTQTLNRGDWKVMENEWKEALSKIPPDEVKVDIQIIYAAESKRPKMFNVHYFINGIENERLFIN